MASSPTSRLRPRLNSSSSSGLNPEPEPEPEPELTSVTITVAEQKELNKIADNTAVHLDTAKSIGAPLVLKAPLKVLAMAGVSMNSGYIRHSRAELAASRAPKRLGSSCIISKDPSITSSTHQKI